MTWVGGADAPSLVSAINLLPGVTDMSNRRYSAGGSVALSGLSGTWMRARSSVSSNDVGTFTSTKSPSCLRAPRLPFVAAASAVATPRGSSGGSQLLATESSARWQSVRRACIDPPDPDNFFGPGRLGRWDGAVRSPSSRPREAVGSPKAPSHEHAGGCRAWPRMLRPLHAVCFALRRAPCSERPKSRVITNEQKPGFLRRNYHPGRLRLRLPRISHRVSSLHLPRTPRASSPTRPKSPTTNATSCMP